MLVILGCCFYNPNRHSGDSSGFLSKTLTYKKGHSLMVVNGKGPATFNAFLLGSYYDRTCGSVNGLVLILYRTGSNPASRIPDM